MFWTVWWMYKHTTSHLESNKRKGFRWGSGGWEVWGVARPFGSQSLAVTNRVTEPLVGWQMRASVCLVQWAGRASLTGCCVVLYYFAVTVIWSHNLQLLLTKYPSAKTYLEKSIPKQYASIYAWAQEWMFLVWTGFRLDAIPLKVYEYNWVLFSRTIKFMKTDSTLP